MCHLLDVPQVTYGKMFIWLCEGLRTENVTCDEDCIAPRGIFVIVPLLLVLFKKCLFTSFSLHREDMNAK